MPVTGPSAQEYFLNSMGRSSFATEACRVADGVDNEGCRVTKVVDRGGVEWGGCATGLSQVSTSVAARHGGVAKMDRLWLLLKDCWAEGPVTGPP